jgi:transcriptional regulator with PAS, ATPase and Fis domain
MISTHQDSFDFHGRTSSVMSVKAFRSVPDRDKASLEEFNTKLIGDSQIMRNLKRSIQTVATSSETVLITGESGTGKELIARAIHDLSSLRTNPFLPVNCGALTESLLESELFGHVKGAFTGATTNKKGFFEAASGGTIFLDEFAEMSLTTQQRLLRVLQERTVRPVGSTDPREVEIDTRVVVATNHDLKHDISEGKFRHDLYYRVNVLQIHSPALRDRREDILALAQHFLRKYNDKNSAKVSERISSEVLTVLEAYSWLGNVRELENIIKRLALSASIEGVITRAALHRVPEFDQFLSGSIPPTPGLTEQHQVSRKLNCMSGRRNEPGQCRCIEEKLNEYRSLVDEAGGNLAAAARRLKIPRTTLRKRIVSLQNKCKAGNGDFP